MEWKDYKKRLEEIFAKQISVTDRLAYGRLILLKEMVDELRKLNKSLKGIAKKAKVGV